MPETTIHFYKDEDGTVPFQEWLEQLAQQNLKAQKKCIAYLQRLRAEGHQLKRPTADTLWDGIYELRPSYQGVHYRILYGFAGKDLVVVSHGITKERLVPPQEIDKAAARLAQYQRNPKQHGHPEDVING